MKQERICIRCGAKYMRGSTRYGTEYLGYYCADCDSRSDIWDDSQS